MSLPAELYEKKRKRRYEQIVDFSTHLHKTTVSQEFMGSNMDSFMHTLKELAAAVTNYNKDYSKDHMIPEEPNIKQLSQLRVERQAERAMNGAA